MIAIVMNKASVKKFKFRFIHRLLYYWALHNFSGIYKDDYIITKDLALNR